MTMQETPTRRYHQGWQYAYHPDAAQRHRWQATRHGRTLRSSTEDAVKRMIESVLEHGDPGINTVN